LGDKWWCMIIYICYIFYRYANHVWVCRTDRINHADECVLPPTTRTTFILVSLFFISRILSTSRLHGSFIQFQSSEFPPSLESLWNALWPWSSELPPCFKWAQILKSRSYSIRFKPEFPAATDNFSTVITPESLIGLRHMGSRQEAEKVSYDVGIEGFLRWLLNWGQNRRFLIMFNFTQNRTSAADQLPKVITPKLLILSCCTNNHLKAEKVLHDFPILPLVWFLHIGIRIAFPDCIVRSSQIRRRCQFFCFDILLAGLKMTTSFNILAAYCDVYYIT
jgi:hypothetical protein